MARRLEDQTITLTKECNVCKHSISFDVSEEGYKRFQAGTYIQRALPEVAAGLRELLLSGICPKCWDGLFNEDYSEQNNGEFDGLTDDQIMDLN